MGKCHFNEKWLHEKDHSGHSISTWAVKLDEESVFCKVCDKKISVQRGIQSILQHARGENHCQQYRIKFQSNQLHLKNIVDHPCTIPTTSRVPAGGTIQLYSIKESATVAELIWTMRAVAHNYSFNSCDGITETFKAMFPGISQDFFLSSTKMRYLCTEALGPFFREKLLDDIQGAYYTLCYDETTNAADEKEFQIQLRYWSSHENCVVSKHLNTSFLKHGTAAILFEEINKSLSAANLPKQKLLMLGADGPNVNKTR